jgi:hypothetical protein
MNLMLAVPGDRGLQLCGGEMPTAALSQFRVTPARRHRGMARNQRNSSSEPLVQLQATALIHPPLISLDPAGRLPSDYAVIAVIAVMQ